MRYGIVILLLVTAIHLHAQPKDTRAELKISGRLDEVSAAPNGKIWLVTATGKTYYTNSIDSNWHYGKPLFIETGDYGVNNPFLERVSFFNKDTAIITGYISADNDGSKKNGYYYTKDGGKNWKLSNYDGDDWIYDAFAQKSGNAWMGGSSGAIYFSKNYGQKWIKLNSPYNSSTRMSSIFMRNSMMGVSGALYNYIYTTNDNWNICKKTPTPLDQKKYVSKQEADGRINKIALWNNTIVVNQDGNIFYSDFENIQWKKFPVSIISFSFDDESNSLFGITDSLKIVLFSSPDKFVFLNEKSLSSYPLNIKAVNGTLFALDNSYHVYKINSKTFKESHLFTTDHKIQDLPVVKKFGDMLWGASGNNLYLAEKNKRNDYDWYREHILSFAVADITPINNHEAILLDEASNNYLYSIEKHSAVLYHLQKPLAKFLQFPIKSVLITAGSDGCFHSISNSVVYKISDKNNLSTKEFVIKNNSDTPNEPFTNEINSKVLVDILSSINLDPSFVPSIRDFNITENDRKNYIDIVNKNSGDDREASIYQINNKELYINVFKIIDTLKPSLLQKILDESEGVVSTTTDWFNIKIINQDNDTLSINSKYYVHKPPWNLPWVFEYNGTTFNCYDLKFSKFINDCIPQKFMWKESFDNSLLILKIAHYFDEQNNDSDH